MCSSTTSTVPAVLGPVVRTVWGCWPFVKKVSTYIMWSLYIPEYGSMLGVISMINYQPTVRDYRIIKQSHSILTNGHCITVTGTVYL
jgi:hypothetical protein